MKYDIDGEILDVKIGAAMSVPRLGFMDNFFCAFQALMPLHIGLRKHTGAFWGQCLTRTIEEWISEDADWILTIDYDTIFTRDDIHKLITLIHKYPEADAIAPIQTHRMKNTPLMTMRGDDGFNKAEVTYDTFAPDITQIATAHFGCVLLRVDAIKKLSKPWFLGTPDEEGRWGDNKVDDDIFFWRNWEASGNTLYQANRVPVGHAELMIRWPDERLGMVLQHPSEFYDKGKPDEVWK